MMKIGDDGLRWVTGCDVVQTSVTAFGVGRRRHGSNESRYLQSVGYGRTKSKYLAASSSGPLDTRLALSEVECTQDAVVLH